MKNFKTKYKNYDSDYIDNTLCLVKFSIFKLIKCLCISDYIILY